MWQSTYSRRRQQALARKKEKQRQSLRLQLKRVSAQLKFPADGGLEQSTPATVLPARVVLNDINPRGLTLFSPGGILVGETVSITLDEPKQFYIRGKVVWCQLVESRVLTSDMAFSYRMGIEFIFETEQDAEAAKSFCEIIKDGWVYPPLPEHKKAA